MVNEKINILKLLIENQEKEFSIRQIAKLRNINYKSAYQNVMTLQKEDVIEIKKQGNISLCSFNGSFNESVFIVEYQRRKALLEKTKAFKVLYNRLKSISQQFIIILFGSYVKGKTTKQSDIDLLLITNQPNKIQNVIELLPLKIHLTKVSYKNFDAMLKSKELTVISEAVKKNILLFGIEDYYRMLENAK